MKLNDPAKITLRRTFAIFALAVFMTEENELALSDLVYWANRDSIAFKVSFTIWCDCVTNAAKFNSYSFGLRQF